MPTELELIRAAVAAHPEMAARVAKLAEMGILVPIDVPLPDEDLTIVAALEHNSMTGAKREQCAMCRCNVWIAPSTQAMIAKRTRREGDEIICPVCFGRKLEKKAKERE